MIILHHNYSTLWKKVKKKEKETSLIVIYIATFSLTICSLLRIADCFCFFEFAIFDYYCIVLKENCSYSKIHIDLQQKETVKSVQAYKVFPNNRKKSCIFKKHSSF